MNILWAVGAFILILTPIILVHELGHFLSALYFKIKVEEFGIGFPPRAATLFKRNGTIFSLNWIPLGGFVRPAGEDDPNIPGGLASASKTARFVVLSAGAGFNFIAAIVVFWIAFAIVGAPQFDESLVAFGDVQEGSPADAVGLLAEDIVVAVNGVEVGDSIELVQDELKANAGQDVTLTIIRGGDVLDVVVRPRLPEDLNPGEGAVGVVLTRPLLPDRVREGPLEALVTSVESTWNVIYLTLSAPAMLIRGQLSPEQARPLSPIGISQIAGRTAELTATSGDWFPLLQLIAVINVALGFTNLLPLPALDGGRLTFVLIEAIRGRRIEPEREGMVHVVGLLFLLGLMVILLVQDIVNPVF